MVEIEHHACAFHQLSLKNIKIKKKKSAAHKWKMEMVFLMS